MDSRAAIILLFIIAYLIFANDTGTQLRGGDAQASLESAVSEARHLLDIIGNATYDDAGRILTTGNETDGFGHVKDYAWHALPKVQERVESHVKHAFTAHAASLDSLDQFVENRLWQNITGEARGEWMRSGIASPEHVPLLNMSRYSNAGPLGASRHTHFERNFTKSLGHVSFGIRETEVSEKSVLHDELEGKVAAIVAAMTLSEDETEQEEEIQLKGVYFPQLGHAVMSTSSSKFAGLFALPLFAGSEVMFDLSRRLINDTVSRLIAESDNDKLALINPWGSSLAEGSQAASGPPKCEMIVYLQQIPTSEPLSVGKLSMLDNELRFPTGAPFGHVPKMHFSVLIFSPDCGFILESRGPPDVSPREYDHLYGYKQEMLQSRGRHHMLLYGIVIVLQLVTLLRQMRESNTPSTRSRVSFYTIAAMVVGDAFATIVFITISLFLDSLWITVMSTAFFSLMSELLFGARFLSDIWAVHAPERRRQEQEAIERNRQRRQNAIAAARGRMQSSYNVTRSQQDPADAAEPQPASDLAAAPEVSQPPVAVDFGSLPVFMPSDQAGLQAANPEVPQVTTFGSIYMRLGFFQIGLLFLSVTAITFPDTLRTIYFTLLTLAYLSFWVPQIWRNAWRNSRQALKWEFVAAQSMLRLVPVVYFFGWSGNVLSVEPHLKTLAMLCIWQWLQILMLVSQAIVGPRWFVKPEWVPTAWDYHPLLQRDAEDFAMPLGLAETEIASPTSPRLRRSSTSDKRDSTDDRSNVTKRVYDCAICMQELEVPIIDSSNDGNASATSYLLIRRTYMITPCRHIFHSKCLEGWMKYRMQCPICREELPP